MAGTGLGPIPSPAPRPFRRPWPLRDPGRRCSLPFERPSSAASRPHPIRIVNQGDGIEGRLRSFDWKDFPHFPDFGDPRRHI